MKFLTVGLLVGLCGLLCVDPVLGQLSKADSVLWERGTRAFENENYEEAVEVFDKLLWRDSLHVPARAQLARAHKALGNQVQASHQARLALRKEPENVEYLMLRYEIGFVQPRVVSQGLKRSILNRILAIDSTHAFAHTEVGREYALKYFHHKGRIRIPDYRPERATINGSQIRVPGSVQSAARARVQDPFDLAEMKAQGYTIVKEHFRADESFPLALHHLKTALQRDPAYRPAYDLLMGVLAFAERYNDMYHWASTMKGYLGQDPYSHLFLGYAAYKLGELIKADQHFGRGIALFDDSDAIVFNDFSRILNKELIKEVDEQQSAEGFWAGSDPLYLSNVNERELEHYTRLIFSYLLFGEPALHMKGWDAERGEVYVRYGQPEDMYYLTMAAEDCDIGQTPVGLKTGENNITNFHVFDYGDYRFVFGQGGNFASTSVENDASNINIPALNEFPLFSTCASANASSWSRGADMDYVTRTRGLIRSTPDAFELPGYVVDFPYLTTVLKGQESLADIVVTYGFPVHLTATQKTNTGNDELYILGIEVGAFLVNEAGEQQALNQRTIGGVYAGEVLQYDDATLWHGAHRLQAESGSYMLSVEFQRNSGAAVGVKQEDLDIPDFNSEELMMSDILLAYFIEDATERSYVDGIITRNGLDIQAAPWGVYEDGRSVYFYFEMYNMKATDGAPAPYSIEAVLVDEKSAQRGRNRLFRRLRRDLGSGVAVSFEGTANTPDINQYLVLDTEGVEEGNYTLIVRVTDTVSGNIVEKERTIYVQ